MAYKNQDLRRATQRKNYRKKKELEKLGEEKMGKETEKDFDATTNSEVKILPNDIGLPAEIVHTPKPGLPIREMIHKATDDPVTGAADPFIERIEKIEKIFSKYQPIISKVVEGIAGAIKARQNGIISKAKPVSNLPQPPAGWLEMGEMQKFGLQHKRPEWYAAGLAYEAAMSGQPPPQIAAPVVPQTREDYTDGTGQPIQDIKRSKEEYFPVKEATEENNNDSKHSNEPVPTDSESEEETLKMTLGEDNLRIMQEGINKLKDMSMETFQEHVNNIDALVEKYLPMKMFIPIQVKSMIKENSGEAFGKVLENQDKEKYDWLVAENKLEPLIKKFDLLRAEL